MLVLRKVLVPAFSLSKSVGAPSLLSKRSCNRTDNVRHYGQAYEGDGKTHAVLLNDDGTSLMINSYSPIGFTLNNGLSVIGPLAIFPNCVLSWNVGDVTHINEKSLSLFLKLEPKLDILVLGVPDYQKKSRNKLLSLANMIRKYKVQVEIMSPELACPTFNFLVAEQRFVGGGILPPLEVEGSDSTALGAKSTLGYVDPTDR